MPYLYATERRDYADYASGRVFYGLPGHPAFPVRLASEILQRCVAVRSAGGSTAPVTLYDPCCGGAYHLATLAYLHWAAIAEIVGSDVDEQALSLAERNLSLLTVEGIDRRIADLTGMLAAYGKGSHAAALESAHRLRRQLREWTQAHPIRTRLFRADATDARALAGELRGQAIDVVIADVPYGQRSHWQTGDAAEAPAWQMLEVLLPFVSPESVVAVAADKRQKILHEGYRRVERFRLGTRQVVLLRPGEQGPPRQPEGRSA